VQVLAWAAVIIYPIGVWLSCVVLLWSASTAIVSGEPTPFSRCISFLFLQYKVATYWWELMEMMRKFILVGLMVVVCRGSILQLAIGTVVNAAYLVSAHRFSACCHCFALRGCYRAPRVPSYRTWQMMLLQAQPYTHHCEYCRRDSHLWVIVAPLTRAAIVSPVCSNFTAKPRG
jgi:hypothetical protein